MARRETKYHYIYKTTNILTERYYYGMHSTNNLDDDYVGSGKRLKYSINKYGKENHQVEILEFCPDRSSLIEKEKNLITMNEIAKVDCMNLKVGGEGGFFSEEQQKNRSSCAGKAYANKLKNNPEFRKILSKKRSKTQKENWKNGVYKNRKNVGFINKKHTEETKKMMGEIKRGNGVGENNSQYNTCWITNNVENKKIKKKDISKYVNDTLNWKLGRHI